eukprot:CFRG7557T1
MLACVACAQRDPIDEYITTKDSEIRMNQIQLLGSHNSYHIAPDRDVLSLLKEVEAIAGVNSAPGLDYTHLSLTDQLNLQNVRHFEFDVFHDPDGGKYKNFSFLKLLNRDTAIGGVEMEQPGYKVLHIPDIDPRSTCNTLVQCLTEIRDWSDANPFHLPIMIAIQVSEDNVTDTFKLGFAEPVLADLVALEAEVRSVFSVTDDLASSRLITPKHILDQSDYASIRATVTNVGWPTLADTRGKIVMIIEGDETIAPRYTGGSITLDGLAMFPYSDPSRADCAFVQRNDPLLDRDEEDGINVLVQAGYMVRTRTDSVTMEARSGAVAARDTAISVDPFDVSSGAHYISTDYPQVLSATQIPSDITTGYGVFFQPRCNVVNGPEDCAIAEFAQAPITSPVAQPPFTDGSTLDFESLFNGPLNLNQTITFFRNWALLAGLYTPYVFFEDLAGYVVPIYSRSSTAELLHEVPRLTGNNKFDYSSEYAAGLAVLVAPFLIGALIVGLISLLVFFQCTCMPCKCFCRRLKYPRNEKQAMFCTIWFFLFLTVCLVGAGIAIYGDVMVTRAAKESTASVNNGIDIFRTVERISFLVFTSVADVDRRIAGIQELCPGEIAEGLTNVRSSLQDLFTFVSDVYNSIEGLPEEVQNASDLLNNVNTWQNAVALLFLILCVLILILFTVALLMGPLMCNIQGEVGKRRMQVTKFCFIPLAALIMCATIVIIGLMFAFNVGLSDFCFDPDGTVLKLIPNGNEELIAHYTHCQSTNKLLDELNESGEMLSLLRDFAPLTNLTIGLCPVSAHPDINMELDIINQAVNNTFAEMDDARYMAKCSTVNGIYTQLVYSSLCTDMNSALLWLWVGLTVLVVGMLPTLWIFGAIAYSDTDIKGAKTSAALGCNDPHGFNAALEKCKINEEPVPIGGDTSHNDNVVLDNQKKTLYVDSYNIAVETRSVNSDCSSASDSVRHGAKVCKQPVHYGKRRASKVESTTQVFKC